MASNGFQGSYANERPPSSQGSAAGDADGNDPASSGFFSNDYKRHDDLKQMLDTNKDSLKLEAMKRIIGMVAKGKDASDLFPAVVKNVVSKNIEVKKLVYVYLTRYAEEQQDLALLSISTFQRALKDPNQLIRASALRVLSSIRVQMIVPIMMLAIKESVMDMSPYVRKTAAHAIPKLYSIDPEQKDLLIEVIEKLLSDKTTLVAGSAIQAFEEVCPERIDLIHKNYRKLCNLLVDVDEWGQVAIINMLTRYCRTQFVSPNQDDTLEETDEKAFYASDSSDSSKASEDQPKKRPYVMDPDHRLLLRNAKPLLNSRNASVVMAVAQLFHHCAPRAEVGLVSKALIRLLRSHKEVQFVVLSNIASMSVNRKDMFEPFLKSFYIRPMDPTQVKLLKLEILTNLATESNISTMLREFQTYVTSADQEFAAATIQAIGRCASSISEITDQCLSGLCGLLSNRNAREGISELYEAVVGESVVVIKKLLQMQSSEHKEIISQLARLVDNITVPLAKASILWLIGEYSDRVPKIAPDVLRKMAKTFTDEEDVVKLQIINLAAKLCITNSKQTKLLCQYVFNLAKYDQNYDIRDRTRLLRQLILPSDKAGALSKHAKKIFLSTKPAPVLQSKFKERDQYQLGTLSHVINARANGYQEIPDWPTEAPDPGVRNVEVVKPWPETRKTKQADKKKSFYSSSGSTTTEGADSTASSSGDESDSEGSSSGSSSSSSSSSSGSESDSDASGSEQETPAPKKGKEKKKPEVLVADLMSAESPAKPATAPARHQPKSESSSGSGSSSSDSDSDSSSSEEEIVVKKKTMKMKAKKEEKKAKPAPAPVKPSANLLDLDDFGPSMPAAPVLTPGGFLSPSTPSQPAQPKLKPNYEVLSTCFSPQTEHELLNKFAGAGLVVTYRFTRTVSIFSPKMISVELVFTNQSEDPVSALQIADQKLQNGMQLQEFPEIPSIQPNTTTSVIMGIDFNDTTQAAQFSIATQEKKFPVKIVPPVGELLQPNTMTEGDFCSMQGKLTGMTENSATVSLTNSDAHTIGKAVQSAANVLQVPSSGENTYYFAGKTVSSGTDLLISVKVTDKKAKLTVNCEKMVIGSMLLRDIKQNLAS